MFSIYCRAPSLVCALRIACAAILAAGVSLGAGSVVAATFTISSPSTTAQTLAAGQTGTITLAGVLTVNAGTVAVTITGNNATLTNLGTLNQIGTGRAIRDNTGVTGLVVNNGSISNSSALIQTADADVIQMNVANGSATLNNYGTMTSLNASAGGSQAVDFSAITTGANTINNFATGIMQASQADAVRPGVNGVVYNAGLIKSTTTNGSSSDGVDAQNNSGLVITNDTTGVISSARHGITGGPLNAASVFTMSVTNNLGGVIQGNNGSGINLDGFNANQSAIIFNGGTITGNGITGDGDGIDSDGLINITNTGIIRSINAFSAAGSPPAQSEGISVGGGTIINSGTIEGLVAAGNTNAVGRGISLLGNDITIGPLAGTREAIYGNAVVTNQAGGLIRGQSDSSIVVEGPASGFTVTINNLPGGTIQGGGATTAAIQTGADNDTINNAGIINGLSSGKAINMGAGNNTLNITGGAASIIGDINGGAGGANVLTIHPGAGNAFAYAGSIANFSSVEIKSGVVTLTGNNTYSGTTGITGGTLVALATGGAQALGATASVDIANGGALKLGASHQINNAANLILSGGTFDLNNFSEGSTGVAGLGSLLVSATSTIDFGDLGMGANLLEFGGIGAHTAGAQLLITDFDLGLDHFYFSGLDVDNFTRLYGQTDVCFNGRCGYTVAGFGNFFEIAALVPEPMTLSLFVFGLAGLGYSRRRPM